MTQATIGEILETVEATMSKVTIRILQQGDESALEAFLLPRLESSMFLFGNMHTAGFSDEGNRFEGTYAAALDAGEIVAVVAHYWNNNLVLQATIHLKELLQSVTSASGRPVAGLLGPDKQVCEAKELLKLDPGCLKHDEAEWLYSLSLDNLIVPELLTSGRARVRLAQDTDIELLTEWRICLMIEALNEKDSTELRNKTRTVTKSAIEAGQIWILEVDGEPKATSGFNAAVANSSGIGIVQIGGVFTPREKRSLGYGRTAVAGSLLAARAGAVTKAILFTGANNLPAQKAYLALGFQRIGTYRLTFLR